MLRAIRLRHGRRRRFRDRVLVAMLTVALIPLVIFAIVVAADLGSVSNSTVDSADKAILDDATQSQQTELDNAAGTLTTQVNQLANQVQSLRDAVAGALRTTAVAGAAATTPAHIPAMKAAAQLSYLDEPSSGGKGSTVILAGPPPAAGAAPRSDVDGAYFVTSAAEPQLETGLRSIQGARAVWVAETGVGLVRVVPGIAVASDVSDGHLAPTTPLSSSGHAPFSALAQRPTDTSETAAWGAADQASPQQSAPQTHFTATYATGAPGGIGMTAWMQVPGTDYQVGVDVDVRLIVGDVSAISHQPDSYAVLLDTSGRILGGSQAAVSVISDFGLDRSNWLGTSLKPKDSSLAARLSGVLVSGVTSSSSAQPIDTTLGGTSKVVLTTPIGGAHWVLASVVPLDPLLPNKAALTRGVDSGVQRIFRDALTVGAGLCVLAFILASLLARRVVGPVNALGVAAERLGSGDIEAPVPAQGRDEVGLLAVNLERMRREVNASRDAIMAAARELEGRVADRTAELRDRNEELVALNTLAGSLTRSLDPEALLEGALDTLRAVVPMTAGTAMALEGGILTTRVVWRAESDAAVDDHLAGMAREAVDARELTLRPGADGSVLVGLPLQTRDGVQGAIALAARPGWQLSGRSRALVRAIADQVGLALRTAALSAEGRELAVLEERTRLAREIHDTIAQQLTAIVLQLEAAEALVGRDESRARSIVVTARHLARSALQEARQSVWNLRPLSLEQTGLAGALGIEVTRWQSRTGIQASLRTADIPRHLSLQPQTEVALFRIVQEALSNVAKHSEARRVDVRLELAAGELLLFVRDDGEGFDVDDRTHPGAFGLVGMQERARLIGAELSIASAPGKGTEVLVSLPLAGPAAAAGGDVAAASAVSA
jgi:nitrate/nitrite-specific signal transduction histidine kinase